MEIYYDWCMGVHAPAVDKSTNAKEIRKDKRKGRLREKKVIERGNEVG